MKRVQGYLIDRETGAGISGKTVSFENLAGAAITTATTYAQAVDSVTDADGKFEAWFELSPGPVNIQVDVSGTEVKVRKHDEMAQFGTVWSSDIGRMGRVFPDGVIADYLNELAVSSPSGHNIVIATGAAIIHGHIFSIENGPMTIVGTANTNPAINPRIDLVTLRQHHEDAAGQDSGRQEVVVTLGTSSGAVPATPTGSDFTDLPLALVSTAYLASSKTMADDMRVYANRASAIFEYDDHSWNPVGTTFASYGNIVVTGVNPAEVYDGEVSIQGYTSFAASAASYQTARFAIEIDFDDLAIGSMLTDQLVGGLHSAATTQTDYGFFHWREPILGLTGYSTITIPYSIRNIVAAGGTANLHAQLLLYPRR